MSLLALTCRSLDLHDVAYAIIGATALAAHGVTRATADLDLLVTDLRSLDAAMWSPLEASGATVDVRRGDADDPLAGVIRITTTDELPIDVIVGRFRWQTTVLDRAVAVSLAGIHVPIARPADLVLLKLYAGGPQDAWDIAQLLDAVPSALSEVNEQVASLPPDAQALWQRIVADH
jgi:hypothetical protein